jgi:hypothetical protein
MDSVLSEDNYYYPARLAPLGNPIEENIRIISINIEQTKAK